MFLKKFCFSILLLVIYIITKTTAHMYGEYYHNNIYPEINFYLKNISLINNYSIGDFIYLFLGFFFIITSYLMVKNKMWYKLINSIINTSLLFLITFHFLWGINNYKTPLHKSLNLQKGYTEEELFYFTEKKIEAINTLHLSITEEDKAVTIEDNLQAFNNEAFDRYKSVWFLKKYNIDYLTNVKPSFFSYFLTKAGFSGYFNPFTHENQINYEIPVIGKPVTIVHEMSHQLGFASETEANFIAYYTLSNSANLKYKYAANLNAIKYLLGEVKKINEEKFYIFEAKLNQGILKNISETRTFWSENKNFSSYIFKPIYGLFLKTNNQQEGIRSYNRMVDLLINYYKVYKE